MEKMFKTLLGTVGLGIVTLMLLGMMAVTKTGFVIVDGWEVGVKKSGTTYVMEELTPGYYFFMPLYSTIDDVNTRPVMFNWSKFNKDKESSDEMRYNRMITGVDKNGIPLSIALTMEITPVKSEMAEMYSVTGSYENAMDKKAIEPTMSIVKNVMGEFDAKDIQSKRGEVSAMLNKLLVKFYAENKYFKLDSMVDLKEIEVPKSVLDIQLKVQAAKQQVEIKRQEVLKAKQTALEAEEKARGVANAVKIAAEGKASAILLEATAQAKANRLVSASLTEKILRNNAIQRWDGVKSRVQAGNSGLIIDLGKVSK